MGRKIALAAFVELLVYAHSAADARFEDLVVDTQFLSDKIGRPDWVILDTRTLAEYQEGHIQGAINLGKRGTR